jgi:hypothetical protein
MLKSYHCSYENQRFLFVASNIQDARSGKTHARRQLRSLVALKEFTAAMVMGWSFCRHV